MKEILIFVEQHKCLLQKFKMEKSEEYLGQRSSTFHCGSLV